MLCCLIINVVIIIIVVVINIVIIISVIILISQDRISPFAITNIFITNILPGITLAALAVGELGEGGTPTPNQNWVLIIELSIVRRMILGHIGIRRNVA